MSSILDNLMLITMMSGMAAVAVYCKWSMWREARGLEIHAHCDGTVHEHFRGSVPHNHPTLAERHEALVSRLFRETV